MNISNRPGAVDDLNRLYREAIRRHAADPEGYRREICATHQYEEYNPQCGDRILILLQIDGDQVETVAFEGEACAICMASASLLCGHVSGTRVTNLRRLHDRLHEALSSENDAENLEGLGPLLGVRPYPSRVRCATLPWTAAIKALS